MFPWHQVQLNAGHGGDSITGEWKRASAAARAYSWLGIAVLVSALDDFTRGPTAK